jgi:cysteine desulfurase
MNHLGLEVKGDAVIVMGRQINEVIKKPDHLDPYRRNAAMPEDAPIYLDYNATTPLLPQVVDAMIPYLRAHFGNPSSNHIVGRRARRAVDKARRQVADLIGASPSEIVFTSGGTEANNLAIQGVAGARRDRRRVVSSVIEHPATEKPCRHLAEQGWSVAFLDVDAQGRVLVEEGRSSIDEDTALVTVMHSNNETGVIQPLKELVALANEVGATVHTDAAQSVGKVPIDVDELGVDLLSLAGHKVYAPKGVGALYVRRGTELLPLLHGAGHEGGRRPGTENVASIVGLGVACEMAAADLEDNARRVESLRQLLWDQLKAAIPGLELNGHREHRLPNTLNVRFPGVAGNVVLANAPQIAASTGSACHGGRQAASKVILSMDIAPDQALGSVRLSLGRCTTKAQIEAAAAALIEAWRSARESAI